MSSMREMGLPLHRLLAGWVAVPQKPVQVHGLCHNSRSVQPGDLFFALAGIHSHGMAHAAEVAAAGAAAILYDPADSGEALARQVGLEIPVLPVEKLDKLMGFIADRFFDEPSAHLKVVAVTGTNGKTSCSHFLAQALDDGGSAAVIGTLGWGATGDLQPTIHTTPEAIMTHTVLAKLRQAGFVDVAIETSSHGLHQGRINGVRLEGGLFTNFTRDHLDYHISMQAYLEAKLNLVVWPDLGYLVFNLDDPVAEAILQRTPDSVRKIGFTLKQTCEPIAGVDIVKASAIRQDHAGVAFAVHFGSDQAQVAAPLYGECNVENLLGTLGVLLAKGFGLEEAAARLRRVRAVPGRMEQFTDASGRSVVVDYAHTPDALQKSLASLRGHCRGELAIVFGCGGDRDHGKRPEMGAIAGQLADRVVLTDDNPRTEDGAAIVAEILAGCDRADILIQRDRRLAITEAVARLKVGDVLLVAGKGHEQTQEINGVKYPFSDRAIVSQLLETANREASLCA
jgi:UDP-N-acetylmuramoyl-L-alanyl-D-glutamate--2,6-diaminopimelate ligase